MNWYWRCLLLCLMASAIWLGISGYRLAKVIRDTAIMERVFKSSGDPEGVCWPNDRAVNTKTGTVFVCIDTQIWVVPAKSVPPGAPTVTVQ